MWLHKDSITHTVEKLTDAVKRDRKTFDKKEHKTMAIKGMEVTSEYTVEHHAEKEINNYNNGKSKNH